MKNIETIFYPALLTILAACNSNSSHNTVETNMPATDTMHATKPVKKFADIQFASKKDTTCGMPITAGLEDTLMLNGRVYGFCSGECKADFANLLIKQHKR
ncbi:hypothetical protein BH11BAC3_BH11BAC3_37320 [soil metagenome]